MRRKVKDRTQLDMYEQQKQAWLDQARLVAQRIAYEEGSVTAEDIRVQCPIPGGIHRNTMGKIFADPKTFVSNGFKKSRTPSRNGAIICVWQLTEEARLHWMSHYKRKAG